LSELGASPADRAARQSSSFAPLTPTRRVTQQKKRGLEMKRSTQREGFTLVEILIVVVIMAVLAATIIPQFSSSTDDAKLNTLSFNLRTLRTQIELYKLHHNGALPTVTTNDLPQLYNATDIDGAVGTPGPSYPFGPYIMGSALPLNPLNNSNYVTSTTTWPPAAATTNGGWFYNPNTGQIAANHADHLGK
jgi:general secretion pathway protein G